MAAIQIEFPDATAQAPEGMAAMLARMLAQAAGQIEASISIH